MIEDILENHPEIHIFKEHSLVPKTILDATNVTLLVMKLKLSCKCRH